MSYLGNNPNKGSFFQQKFTGDGSATTFTLLQSVTDGSQLIVTIGNVIQEEGSSKAYTASGSTLTFDSAPANGDIIVVRYLGRSLDTPTSYATQITFKYVATNGQTAFTGADANGLTLSYSLGSVDVYLNGVHLDSTDFTETNESTLTLASGATTNDELVIVAKRTITLADVVSKSNGGTFAGAVSFGSGIAGDLSILSTDATNTDGPIVKLTRNSASPAVNDILGSVRLIGKNDADQDVTYGEIDGIIFDETDGTENGALRFTAINNGTQDVYLTLGDEIARFQQNARFDDNVEAKFGTGGDLRIYHNGSNSYIDEGSGTGALIFKASFYSFRNAADSAQMAIFDQGGMVRLFHNGAEKIRTLSDGGQVFGDFTLLNSDADASQNPTLVLKRDSASPADDDFLGDILFQGNNDNSEAIQYAQIHTKITDASDGNEGGFLQFKVMQSGSLDIFAQMAFNNFYVFKQLTMFNTLYMHNNQVIKFEGATGDDHETTLTVQDPTADRTITFPNASGTVITDGNADTPATTSSSSEVDHVLVNDGGIMKKSTIANLGISSGASLSNDANNRVTTATGSGGINGEANFTWNGNEAVMNRGNGTGGIINFKVNGTQVGNIAVFTSGSTSFSSTSDYRLKENVNYSFDATTRLKRLKPCRLNFIADETNTLQDGFLAHEVSSVVPQAIIGEKDEVDSDGNIVAQSIDQSKLIPLLVKTIQELEARITELEK